MMKRTISTVVIATAMLASAHAARAASDEVNLYSYRQPFLIQPMLDVFTEKTGITVNVAYAEEGMLERIKAEGENTPADAVLTADIGRLKDMEDAGVLAAITSDSLSENIPATYRHPDGYWFGLTTRARIIFASKDRVRADEVNSYEDLADPKMKGRICIRSGKHLYNISLIASMIAHKGVEETEKWLSGVKENLARRPQGNDRAQAKAIYEGQCDVAIANTYYMGNMQTNDEKPEQKEWAAAIRIIFPNQGDRGTHVNISGAAVLKHAKRRENALKLLEFLASETAQSMYAAQNFEYPVKPGVPVSERVQSWGSFKADSISLADVAQYRAEAARMVDRIGFDQ